LNLGSIGRTVIIGDLSLPIVPVKERASPPGRFASATYREKSEFAIKASRREIMRDLTHKRGGYTHRETKATTSAEKAKGIS